MTDFRRFNLSSIEDLQEELRVLNLELPVSRDLSILGQPFTLAGRTLSNRFMIQPMEGVDGDPSNGAPTELTFRRYRRFAQGGSALIWAEAVSVLPEGCSGSRQLQLTEKNLDVYKRLVEETRKAAFRRFGHEITFVIQLTHSGRFSRPGGAAKPLKAQHNPHLDSMLGTEDIPPVSDDYLDALQDEFVRVGKLAAGAGYDGVDIKAVHGYLIAELLGSHTRPGKYGGSYENRTRFLKETAGRMMDELPDTCFVTTRTSVLEPLPHPYGWGVEQVENESWKLNLDEPKHLMKECHEMGMPLFNISIGFPRTHPYLNRPHDRTLVGQGPPPEYPLEGVVRYQQIIRDMQKSLPECPVPAAGLTWLRQLLPEVAAGMLKEGWASLIGLGRGAFAYPDMVRDVLETGRAEASKCCTTCSMCSQIMKDGVGCGGCVIRDREIYGPELKKGRLAAKAKGLP